MGEPKSLTSAQHRQPPQPHEEGKTLFVFIVQVRSLRSRTNTEFSLEAVVRQYCHAQIQGPLKKGDPSTTRITSGQLYDILGLLRSLQYDVTQYNTVVAAMNATGGGGGETDIMSKDERRYACYRLRQQATTLGVRLPVPWQQQQQEAQKLIHIAGLDELVAYLEEEFQPRVDHARRTLEQGVVDFDSLMEFYRPGVDLVDYGLLSGLPSALTPLLVTCRASHYARGKSAMGKAISTFHAACEFVVATGADQFALVESRLAHYEFKGTRRIETTAGGGGNITGEICTKVSDPAVLQELAERGRIYQQICSSNHSNTETTNTAASGKLVNYTAGSFWPVHHNTAAARSGGPHGARSSRTGGRMMVDTIEAWSRGIHPAKAPADGVAGEAVAEAFKAVARWNRQHEKEAASAAVAPAATVTEQSEDDSNNDDVMLLRAPLPECLVKKTWPVVCGFSFETRRWGLALVDGITPVQFHEKAFDDLVLPPARKRLLRALITSHGQHRAAAGVDVLPGKGEGIIFLLHGPAGVGKTLTAEAISEVLHRPLYRVSMGELGVTPEDLESRLQDIFDLCLPWQALVLIDEAEMLLETRTNSGTDLVRNAIVCVMLRLMEYYPGILFLTTNSGKERLDPAIASRLTCTLGYDALNEQGRREVWKTTLGRVVVPAVDTNGTTAQQQRGVVLSSAISDLDLDFLAREYVEINGRQIKNSVQLAAALCRYEKTTLQLSQLQETLDMGNVQPRNRD